MSYTPSSSAARSAVDELRIKIGPAWGSKVMSREALREVLIAAQCPLPCVGYVNDTGWHTECEAAADRAMAALSGWGVT